VARVLPRDGEDDAMARTVGRPGRGFKPVRTLDDTHCRPLDQPEEGDGRHCS
jgi:hypothetical protein